MADNYGVADLGELLRSAPARTLDTATSGKLVSVQVRTKQGLLRLTATAETDVVKGQTVKFVVVDDKIVEDAFTGERRLERQLVVRPTK